MSESSLQVEALTKVYAPSGHAPSGGIRGASFDLPSGTFFTLLGPSGCGKTTTLRCIAGLEQPDSGSIRVGGKAFFDDRQGVAVPMNRRNIGMVFQSYAIWPHMTVFENVAFPLRVAKDRTYGRAEIETTVNEALRTVSLDGFGSRPATRLSGGQQQRVALARAIVRKPRLLLLDEPLSNLDASLREEMRNELKRLQQQIGVTTVYVTHDQSEALEMSDTIAVINGGEVVQLGQPRDIYFRPKNAFVAGFVGATNLAHGRIEMSCRDADEIVSVRLDSGALLRARSTSALSASSPVAVSVRPETITLRPVGGAPADGVNRLEGEIAFSGFLGSGHRYGIKVDGDVFQASTGVEADFPIGSRVALDFPPGSAVAVPA